ncbi:hypothetical protein PVAND_011327 [Polypedilum vanderplanki]|uniref:Tetratricopeptide repeat protein 1-like protein n=1 Tax=Polypedilum vanderplanki TaxID=319348 RepID=A0A9J6CIT2_POLVA|nr:hypothetical protein PVAND_011327 [Polypedilum vanderplanki]
MDEKQQIASSDDEQFEDANEKIINDIIDKCEANDLIDDESQRDFEKDQTEEEREEARLLAVELKDKGNVEFRNGNFEISSEIYTQALRKCPVSCSTERSILYGNRSLAKVKLGLKSSAIDDCTKSIEFNPKYVKVLLRRAALYEETNKLDESLDDYKKILELDPGNHEARSAQIRLPPLINERNEKMKEEMIEKLKDLGNLVLRPFGLSTKNFEMKQDPSTGSYSINFNQNPK